MKHQCKKCGRKYKLLTKKDFCASCYKIETGNWADEFSAPKKSK